MKQLLCALICISVLNFSCKKDQEKPIKPVAEFIIVGQDFTAPCLVTFENKSKNSNQYRWDFGNGAEAFQFTPDIIQMNIKYTEAGTYTVTLEAGGQGYISKFTRQITIKP
ncbi:MAG: PKD domain-containing protein [Bacteroidota bacterium]|nr:PKD domain-containing protein [Bacteroidota bacterium]